MTDVFCFYRVILHDLLGSSTFEGFDRVQRRHGDRLDSKRVILHCALDRLRQLEENTRERQRERENRRSEEDRRVLTHLRAGEWETRPDVFSVHPADERWGAIQTGRLLPREELGEQHRVQLDKRERVQFILLKERVHQRMKITPWFTPSQAILGEYDFLLSDECNQSNV